MRYLFRFAGLTLALLLAAGSAVRAQTKLDVADVSGGVVTVITYDTSGSTTNSAMVNIGPFQTSTVVSGPGSILDGALFCVDLWHGQNPGSNLLYNLEPASYLAGTTPSGVTSDSNLVADLNYLGYAYNALYAAGNDATAAAALQLVIWKMVDTGPTGATSNTSTLNTDAANILKLLTGGSNDTGSLSLGGATLYGIASSQYASAQQYTTEIFAIDGSNEQNLASWAPVPEPSTMAIAALGTLGLVGYGLRRKRA